MMVMGESRLRTTTVAALQPSGEASSEPQDRKRSERKRRRSSKDKNKQTTGIRRRQRQTIILVAAVSCLLITVFVAYVSVGVLVILDKSHHANTSRHKLHHERHHVDDGSRELLIDHGRERPSHADDGGGLGSNLRLATLSCDKYGGPYSDTLQEMVYWQRIESDLQYKSPFYDNDSSDSSSIKTKKYMTFQPDGGGFNNIRMAMETVLTLAHAMGRTLVLPPRQEVYLLYDDKHQTQRSTFDFYDFFPIQQISGDGLLDIVSMGDFLQQHGMTGQLKNRRTGETSYPPFNRTDWNGETEAVTEYLNPWLESVAYMPDWSPKHCMAAFPKARNPSDAASLQLRFTGVQKSGGFPPFQKYIGRPVPVDGPALDRLAEHLNGRNELCVYNSTLVQEPLIHFHGKMKYGGRLLVHFYSFLFFEDWRQDVWTKRFVRDHVRYVDEIQCAAARIVAAVRRRARQRNSSDVAGDYDSFHVRRGEFQYKKTRVSAQEMYEISRDVIPDGATVYMATDERRHAFFDDMARHYDLVYLDDFKDLLEGVNTNLYGMIDQLVASRSRVFFGCWFSTFTAYINRIRGYHADRLKLNGFEQGIIESYYYALPQNKMRMKTYWPISGAVYAREFPTSWRHIDHGIDELWSS